MSGKLPIDPVLPRLVEGLDREGAAVLYAPPGAGKTTRVPPALLEAGLADDGEILVLQPRRLPTRLGAERVAAELGEKVGQRVGYQMRYETVAGDTTRIRFLTEGTLTRRLLADPELRGVSAVIFDEVHERNLATDLALALTERLRRTSRPDLKLLAMSATLEAEKFAAYLETTEVITSEGRPYDVEIQHLERPDDRPLEKQVEGAVKRLLAGGVRGHVLVFLPGAAEIRRAAQALAPFAAEKKLRVLPLHGALPARDQEAALAPSERQKIILSTNVAETSVTIEGIEAVIDSGLARMPGHSAFSGLSQLRVAKISQASAIQRAGRAGRTQAGVALRLFTREDFLARPTHDTPELLRADLAETALALHGVGLDPQALRWLDAPAASAWEAAESLLHRLGALKGGALTPIGRRMLAFPVHPRLARWIVEGEALGIADEAALLAALASERDIRARGLGPARAARHEAASDLLEFRDLYRQAERGKASGLGLDPRAVEAVRRAHGQLRRLASGKRREAGDEELLALILTGFPDRVAKRRRERGRELLLSNGQTATLSETSVVAEAPFLVAVEAEMGPGGALVRLASAIEPEWLLEREEIREEDELFWNEERGRVERQERIRYGSLVLHESRTIPPPSAEVSARLAREAYRVWERLVEPEDFRAVRARLALANERSPAFPRLDDETLREALVRLTEGMGSLEELQALDPLEALLSLLLGEDRPRLDRLFPTRITLPSGRQLRVHYEEGRPPWVESRLQDFFGMTEGPAIAGGEIPLTLHLLAPNQRAVQVTQDLAGFWERHYPSLRKELGRRYPKHAWPEDGRTAKPPPPGRIR